jgi:hypothetical protein
MEDGETKKSNSNDSTLKYDIKEIQEGFETDQEWA